MKWAYDRCGAPLLPLDGRTLIHVLPVTVYHVERYVWSEGAAGLDWETILPGARARPESVDVQNAQDLWACRMSAAESKRIAEWLGARLPSLDEWEAVQSSWEDQVVFEGALRAADHPGCDQRVVALTRRLVDLHVKRRSDIVERSFSHIVTPTLGAPSGALLLRSTAGAGGMITDWGTSAYRADDVGFCCVFSARTGAAIHED